MFINVQQKRIIPGCGNPEAKICIVGDAPGAYDERPFMGASGTVLESCLHAAGLTKTDCYMTNVIKVKPSGIKGLDEYFNDAKGTFTSEGVHWIDVLEDELLNTQANVIVPLGTLSSAALLGHTAVSKLRGYVTNTLPRFRSRKAIPTIHPSATIRGQYILRYYITADLRKAKKESEYPEVIRPKRTPIIITTIKDAIEWLEYYREQQLFAADIEVMNFEVSAISFASQTDMGITIPYTAGAWGEDDEITLWKHTALTLSSCKAKKLFQNGIFDVHFLATVCGIHVPLDTALLEDSMIAHSVMYPEMLKGLGFLGSLYCGSQAYWKDMVKFDNIKEES